MAHKRLSIGKAAKYLGVSIDTLRRWEKKGVITAYRSPGGHRYFIDEDLDKLFDQKYNRTEPIREREQKKEKVQVQEEATIAKPLKIESPYPDEVTNSQKSSVVEPEIKPSPQLTTSQSVPVQDTPPSIMTPPHQSVSSTPTAELQERAQEIVSVSKKERNIPWGTIIIVGLIVFVIIDIILFIFYLTSTRTPISSIP